MDRSDWVRITPALLVVTAIAAGLACLGIYGSGVYGLALFFGTPFFIGISVAAVLAAHRPRPLLECLAWACGPPLLLAGLFLITGLEGLMCIATAIPLMLPLVILGTVTGWLLFHRARLGRARSSALGVALLVALGMAAEARLRPTTSPHVAMVEDHHTIDASDAEVWRTIVTLSDVERPDDLFFRTGVACPERTRIVNGEEGGLRVCTLSTGTLLERIDRWEPNRRLAWTALSTPPPMKELNPFRDADPPHLHGFYRNVRGEFELAPAGPGRTRLTRRTWYQQDLYPAAYWRFWCDLGASKIHRLVLEHVAAEALRRGGRSV